LAFFLAVLLVRIGEIHWDQRDGNSVAVRSNYSIFVSPRSILRFKIPILKFHTPATRTPIATATKTDTISSNDTSKTNSKPLEEIIIRRRVRQGRAFGFGGRLGGFGGCLSEDTAIGDVGKISLHTSRITPTTPK
jgi:hypothetical protein